MHNQPCDLNEPCLKFTENIIKRKFNVFFYVEYWIFVISWVKQETGSIFSLALHLWKHQKSCLTSKINSIFTVKTLNTFHIIILFDIQLQLSTQTLFWLSYFVYTTSSTVEECLYDEWSTIYRYKIVN